MGDRRPADGARGRHGAADALGRARRAAGVFAAVNGSPLELRTYAGPVSNDRVDLAFRQHIDSADPLRTGTYSRTLAFTLSTTNP
jgi:hypothetical protein